MRGAGGDDLTLLRSFEPVVRYTEGELFFPTCVQAYVAQCSLWAGADGRAGGEGRAESLLVPAGAQTLDGLCDVAQTSRRDRPLHLRFVQEPLDRASYRQGGAPTGPGCARRAVTDGPIGVGTRFAARMTSGRRRADMVIETTEYDRPSRLGSVTTMDMANINGVITFDAGSVGTVMIWAWEVHPGGVARFFAPLVAIGGRRQERTIWGGLKQYLESTPAPV